MPHLLLDALPYGKYDIPMQRLVTEDTLIKGIEKDEIVI